MTKAFKVLSNILFYTNIISNYISLTINIY